MEGPDVSPSPRPASRCPRPRARAARRVRAGAPWRAGTHRQGGQQLGLRARQPDRLSGRLVEACLPDVQRRGDWCHVCRQERSSGDRLLGAHRRQPRIVEQGVPIRLRARLQPGYGDRHLRHHGGRPGGRHVPILRDCPRGRCLRGCPVERAGVLPGRARWAKLHPRPSAERPGPSQRPDRTGLSHPQGERRRTVLR